MRAGVVVWKSAVLVLSVVLATGVPCEARGERLELRHVVLDLPGPPAKLIPADLDGDGRIDLVVVVAYTEIEEIGEDRVENMVQITTVIPAAFDRREVRAYLATADGGYEPAGEPLDLPPTVLHMEPGPPGLDVIALTDSGLSVLRLDGAADDRRLRLVSLVEERPVLAGTRSFFASLELVDDLDGDGVGDVLFPAADGPVVYLSDAAGSLSRTSQIKAPGGSDDENAKRTRRWYPLPEVRDIDGDGLPDLLFRSRFTWGGFLEQVHVLLGTGGGLFRPIRQERLDCHDDLTDLRFDSQADSNNPWPQTPDDIRDVDGDGRAEVILSTEQARGDSFRKELKDAKRPIQAYSFHRLLDDLSVEREPYYEVEAIGHTMVSDGSEADFPFEIQQFEDLDGDGREDLVTLTLDFSIFQALKILVTKKISVGVEFHVHAQDESGRFHKVPDLDLTEKLKFDLNDLKVARFAQFAGDFDGDGRQDFIHLGRGKRFTLHRGQPGCIYPKNPDLTLVLDEEPASLDLVRIEDLDGDGRSDVVITRPLPQSDIDATAAARLDLYLSSGAAR